MQTNGACWLVYLTPVIRIPLGFPSEIAVLNAPVERHLHEVSSEATRGGTALHCVV